MIIDDDSSISSIESVYEKVENLNSLELFYMPFSEDEEINELKIHATKTEIS